MHAIQNSSTFCGEFCSQGRQQKERLWKVPKDKKLRETAVPHYVERGQKKDQKFWDEILGDDLGRTEEATALG